MELQSTIKWMNSFNYTDRFMDEYYQVAIRLQE